MYSGQEIVSQEECKLVLAEFYDGVQCYNKTDHSIKFSLKDWASATYDATSRVLTTRYFSCWPVNIDTISRIFQAGLDENTTAIQVVMHSDKYTKVRIMPIRYLRQCNRLEYPNYDFNQDIDYSGYYPYLRNYCTEDGNTIIDVYGDIDKIENDKIYVVAETNEPLIISLLDNISLAGMTISGDTIFTIPVEARAIKLEGIYDFEFDLYPCSYDNSWGIINACIENDTVVIQQDSSSTVTKEGYWFDLAGSKFRLYPDATFLRQEDTKFIFSLAQQIEYKDLSGILFDIFPCGYVLPDFPPLEFPEFPSFPPIGYDSIYTDFPELEGIDFSSTSAFILRATLYYKNEWLCDADVQGDFTIDGNRIITTDHYYVLKNKNGTVINLEDPLVGLYVGTCKMFIVRDDGHKQEVNPTSWPISSKPFVTYNKTTCEFELLCENVEIPLDCITCTQVDSQTVDLDTDCTSLEYFSACDCGFGDLPFASYPVLDLSTLECSIEKAEYIYIRDKMAYIVIPTPAFHISIPIIDFTYGIEPISIIQSGAPSARLVDFTYFLYMVIFKLPYVHVHSNGLDFSFWLDWAFWEQEVGFCEEGYRDETAAGIKRPDLDGYDFMIEPDKLIKLIGENFNNPYDWTVACRWMSGTITKSLPNTIGALEYDVTNSEAILELINSLTTTVNSKYSNIPFGNLEVIPPEEAEASMQGVYSQYCDYIKDFAYKNSEGAAYFTGEYIENFVPTSTD